MRRVAGLASQVSGLHTQSAAAAFNIAALGAARDELVRRIAALEAHIADLEDRLNERGVFSGDHVHYLPTSPLAGEDASVQHYRQVSTGPKEPHA